MVCAVITMYGVKLGSVQTSEVYEILLSELYNEEAISNCNAQDSVIDRKRQ